MGGGIPIPPVPLDGICSVIFNKTLYTYSAGAFQSLSLSEGAQWKTLPAGEPVTGGVCVGSTPTDPSQAALFIVGGKASSPGYRGLQKFVYSKGVWETISPSAAVTQDRTGHGAVYLNSSDSILVYAGSQDAGAEHLASSQTFTIGASAPYTVTAFQSIAPPARSPILLQWSETHAVMVGGDAGNTKVMLFNPETSWVDSGTTLASPIPKDITAMQAVLVGGDDGSKSLYTFDMTMSPNQVRRTVLLDGRGAPVVNSPFITARSVEERKETESLERRRKMEDMVGRRELTADHWPAYNGTLAPTITRKNFAVASDEDGLVVIAGGNDEDILCMFDGRGNGWKNATATFVSQKALAEVSSSGTATESVVPSATLSSAPSGATTAGAATSGPAAAAAVGSPTLHPTAILGIALGSIFGAAAILILILLLIRWRKRRRTFFEQGHARRASGLDFYDEKDSVGYSNAAYRGPAIASYPAAAYPAETFRGHHSQDSQASFSSMAILMGRASQQKPATTLKRKPSGGSQDSGSSSVYSRQFKSTISKPIIPTTGQTLPPLGLPSDRGLSFAPVSSPPATPLEQAKRQAEQQQAASKEKAEQQQSATRQLTHAHLPQQPQVQPRPAPAADRQSNARRSSGWNKYWSGGSTLNILGFGSAGRGSGAGATTSQQQSSSGGGAVITQTTLAAAAAAGLGRRGTMASEVSQLTEDASSTYSGGEAARRITQDSATVPPLHLQMPMQHPNVSIETRSSGATSYGAPRFSRVNSGSPTISQYSGALPVQPVRDGVGRALTDRVDSMGRPISSASSAGGYSSGIPASVHDAWDYTANAPYGVTKPATATATTSNAAAKPWGADRAPSNAYSSSIYPTPIVSGHGGGYGYNAASVPSTATTAVARPGTAGTAMTAGSSASASGQRPTGVSQQPQLAVAKLSTDMSWLNLGDNSRLDLGFNPELGGAANQRK